jgi:sulfoxide reductase heme-binding subunit YedZ
MLGLYAFTYAFSHVSRYLLFNLQLEWSLLLSEIIKRPYISVGFVALMILAVLNATSSKYIQRRMDRTWQKNHNWVYLASVLVTLHFLWSVKSGLTEPLIYLSLVAVLLIMRKDKLTKIIKLKRNYLKKRVLT